MDNMNQEQEIRNADCIEEMRDMDSASVHAVVTDPPYNFEGGFMDEEWDNIGSPTVYQDWCKEWASEALRVLKPGGHLIAFSGTRMYGFLMCGVHAADFEIRDTITWHHSQGFGAGKTQDVSNWMDGDEAKQWDGFKMGLKPATELVVLARKPFDGPTYSNILEHGAGALNIGSCRTPEGRYPANVCLDQAAADLLDEQTGVLESGEMSGTITDQGNRIGYQRDTTPDYEYTAYGDSGGASRFYYCAKATQAERSINGRVENDHSTVKPLELMEWLVTLVTAEGQQVLDPFAGSGTTIMACKRLNREGTGIEMDEGHAEIARRRVELAHEVETDFSAPKPSTEDTDNSDGTTTLGSFGSQS